MSIFLLVEARFYPHLNDMLLTGARRAMLSNQRMIAATPPDVIVACSYNAVRVRSHHRRGTR